MDILKRSSSNEEHKDSSNKDLNPNTDTGDNGLNNLDNNDNNKDPDPYQDDHKNENYNTTNTIETSVYYTTTKTTSYQEHTYIEETATSTYYNIPTSSIESTVLPNNEVIFNPKDDLSPTAIIGIISASIVLIIIILCGIFFIIKKSKEKKEKEELDFNDIKPSISIIYGTSHVDKNSAPFPYFDDICNNYANNSEALNNYNYYMNAKYHQNAISNNDSSNVQTNINSPYRNSYQGSSNISNVNMNRPYRHSYQGPVYQEKFNSDGHSYQNSLNQYQTADITQSIPPQNHKINPTYGSPSSPLKKPFPYQSQNIKISDMKYWNYLKEMKKKKEKKKKRKKEKKNTNKIIFIYLKFWNIHN